ncbi:MAG: LolA family protein [Caulobacter sp.]
MSHDLNRRGALAGLAAFAGGGLLATPAFAQLSPADQALVTKATEYLQGLTSAKGRFVQYDPRGVSTGGSFYLQRPGKARFAYDAPSSKVLVSDGSIVAETDTRLKTVSRYPLGATPLALFLARNIRLDKSVRVVSVGRLDGGFSVTVADGGGKARGQLTLNFADGPVRLLGWVIRTAQGSTRVQLTSLERTSGLDPKLFVTPPAPRRQGRP